MLSRVAENLFWLSRYVERAENAARLLDDAFHLELDAAWLDDGETAGAVGSVLDILACRDAFGQAQGANPDTVLRFLTFDRQNSQSILAMIARARENARATQEALSSEAWSQVNRLYLYLSGPRRAAPSGEPVPLLREHQAGLRPLRWPRGQHPAADGGVALPRGGPLPGVRGPD